MTLLSSYRTKKHQYKNQHATQVLVFVQNTTRKILQITISFQSDNYRIIFHFQNTQERDIK